MGGSNYNAKSIKREAQQAAHTQAVTLDLARDALARLPGHVVEVVGRGNYIVLDVDHDARVVYCWRACEPDHVLPVPFSQVYAPLCLVRGAMPEGM